TSQSFTPLENGWYSVQVTFANGCTGMSEEYPFGVTEIEDLNMSVVVYPNPSTGVFNVQVDNALPNVTFNVRDLAGRLVMEGMKAENGKLILDMTFFTEGVYMIEIVNEGVILERKQIIKNT
ncbi:MAG: T9SS type A sorting domain-containing protein, partial [Bacteroidetes bacterium]